MKLFFVVGESSGDALASKLIRELEAIHDTELECLGIGGPMMKAAGFNVLLPSDQISAMGIWELLPKLPRLYKIFNALVEEILSQKPDALITVDFPDFNFKLAKTLKKRGFKGKIIHYVAPSVWAWRPGRAKKIADILDGIMCLYPMEPKYFEEHKLKAICVGHPVIETRADEADGEVFRDANDISADTKTLGLYFGSREGEFKRLSAPLKETALLVNEVKEGIRVIAPTLPDLEFNIQNLLVGFPLPLHVASNQAFKWESFKACDVAVAVSGTVALELAYAGVPHVLIYKANPLTYLTLKPMVKVKYAHLANILLDEEVVPEFIQKNCQSEKIAEKVLELYQDPDLRQKQLDKFEELRKMLGMGDTKTPSRKAAEFVLEIMNK